MKKILSILFSVITYGGLIAIGYTSDNPVLLKISILVFLGLLILITVYRLYTRDLDYFLITFLTFTVLMAWAAFFNVKALNFMLLNMASLIYLALFLTALLPPLIGMDPFTYFYSKKQYPEEIVKTDIFRKINLQITYFWALLFLVCAVIPYLPLIHNIAMLRIGLPIAVIFMIGFPMNKKLPEMLSRGHNQTDNSIPEDPGFTVYQALSGMPSRLKSESTAGINAVIQFKISGKEQFSAYLHINDGKCHFYEGENEKPDCVISTPSDVWLGIITGRIAGQDAYMNKMYSVEGDIGLLFKLGEWF